MYTKKRLCGEYGIMTYTSAVCVYIVVYPSAFPSCDYTSIYAAIFFH